MGLDEATLRSLLGEQTASLAKRAQGELDWLQELIQIFTESNSAEEELARFYERQGGYLALFYALETTDVHCENLIASGEHPIMIDLEALFHPHLEFALASAQALV